MVRTVRQQTERKRGEELARMSAASFALVLSSFPSACSFALSYPHHLKEGRGRGGGRGGQDDRQPEALPCGFWSLARCGDDIGQKRTRWPPVHLPDR